MNEIRKYREKANKSQKELAAEVGVSAPTVSQWESGKKQPSTANLARLAEVLNVSADELLGISKEENNMNQADIEDEEIWQLREELRNRPEMRTLFSISRNASVETIEDAIAVIEALKKKNRK